MYYSHDIYLVYLSQGTFFQHQVKNPAEGLLRDVKGVLL